MLLKNFDCCEVQNITAVRYDGWHPSRKLLRRQVKKDDHFAQYVSHPPINSRHPCLPSNQALNVFICIILCMMGLLLMCVFPFCRTSTRSRIGVERKVVGESGFELLIHGLTRAWELRYKPSVDRDLCASTLCASAPRLTSDSVRTRHIWFVLF